MTLKTENQNSLESKRKFSCSKCGAERPERTTDTPWEWRLCGTCGYDFYWSQREKYESSIKDKMKSILVNMGFPEKLIGCDFELPKSWHEDLNEERGLFLYGPTGTGKTTTIYLMFKQFVESKLNEFSEHLGYPGWSPKAIFVNVPSLMLRLQSMFKKEGQDPNEKIIELAEYPTLIIDDLGAEKMSEWVRQTLYVLLNEREMQCRKTFITSNKSLEQLSEEIDSRIASRIAGMCKVIKLSGSDKRIKK